MKKFFIGLLATLCIIFSTLAVGCGKTPPDLPNLATIEGVTFSDVTYTYDGQEKTILIEGELPEGVTVAYTNNTATIDGVYNATAVLSGDGYKTTTLNAKLTILKAEITNVTFEGDTYTYDGQEKTILIEGDLPDGVGVSYTANKGTDAGTYNAVATISGVGYNTLTLKADLIINKADITGVTFTSQSVEYDTFEHSIEVVGNLPKDSIVSYTYNGKTATSVTEVGTYKVVATITNKNYNTLTLEATLTITTTEELLYSLQVGSNIYFQNNLDENKLYMYSNNTIKKVNNDIPEYMITDGSSVYYYSTSLFSKTIKKLTGTTTSALVNISGEYLAYDGSNFYYAVNNPIINTDKNGIYKFSTSGDSDPIRIVNTKAAYLTYYDNYIYYSNLADDGKLYKISISSQDGTPTKLCDYKVEYILLDDGVLFFNAATTAMGIKTSSAIYKYIIASNKLIKLTIDGGKYLTKVGSFIYYVKDDILSNTLFGKGISRISTLHTSDNGLPGDVILEDENNPFSSLSSDSSNNLFFYRLNNKHFYKYEISTETETDLMENFVPVNDTTLSGFAFTTVYDGEIYYSNPLEDGDLYKYNPVTKSRVKVISNKTSGVWFNNGYMYYATYNIGHSLWKQNLQTNEVIKLTGNSNKLITDLMFDNENDKIYCIVPYLNSPLCSINLSANNVDELEQTEIINDKLHIENVVKVGNTFYYVCRNTGILSTSYVLKSFTLGQSSSVNLNINAKLIEIYNDKIYYYDDANNKLGVCSLDGSNNTTIKSNVEINDMAIIDNVLYYSSLSSSNTGLYSYNLTSTISKTISNSACDGIVGLNGNVYFLKCSSTVNYSAAGVTASQNTKTSFDGKLYKYDGISVSKVA